MDNFEKLAEIGLGGNEAQIYLCLLELGSSKAGSLLKASGLHRQLVYNALDALVERGLASVCRKNNIKHFEAQHPKTLLEEIKRKQKQAEELIPELLKLQGAAEDPLSVTTLVGQESMLVNLKQVIDSAKAGDGVMRIIGGASAAEFYRRIGPYYSQYVEYLNKHKIAKRLLAPTESSKEFKERFVHENKTQLRTLLSGLSSPTYTRITSSMVSIEIYASETIVLQILNHNVAQGYIEHFNLLWSGAE